MRVIALDKLGQIVNETPPPISKITRGKWTGSLQSPEFKVQYHQKRKKKIQEKKMK
jgi:hypothetical protein